MYKLTSILMTVVPFISYFVGIIIRKLALPGKNSLSMSKQLLLGIPVSLLVVTPLLAAFLRLNANDDLVAILLTIGTIMEQGMIVNETATKFIASAIDRIGATADQH